MISKVEKGLNPEYWLAVLRIRGDVITDPKSVRQIFIPDPGPHYIRIGVQFCIAGLMLF
jgi:hypothetical protein